MRRVAAACGAAAMLAAYASPAMGSGDPGPYTVYVDREGGSPAELARLYEGRVGIVLPSSPTPLLYLEWRLLNGLEVGPVAGTALSTPCCDRSTYEPGHGVLAWADAAAQVAAPGVRYIATDRRGPDYTTIPNCFPDAFGVATATLKDRIARFGKGPAVQAWVATQTAVFAACGGENVHLPAPLVDPPTWLRADRAYQEAAFAFYDGHEREALDRFLAIGRDRASPWARMSLYLQVRVIQRHALRQPNPTSFASARAAIDRLARAKPGTYGQSEVRGMRRALAYRDRPEQLLAELDGELHAREPVADIALGLHDYVTLTEHRTPQPDIADWMATIRSADRLPALAHARERWGVTGSPAWLIAALSLARADDPAAAGLVAAAERVPRRDRAWLSVQYHRLRLTLGRADDAGQRGRLDAILATRPAHSDRNIFLALRTQLAIDRGDFVAHALREPFCSEEAGYCTRGRADAQSDPKLGIDPATGRYVAFGGDARAILDRLPLDERMAVGRDPRLPGALRLDLALTNYARAVQLQAARAIDRLAPDLARLLPEMRRDWLAIASARPGPARRFAEIFVLAKIPGVHPDLADDSYTRPSGPLRHYQGRWWDWMIVPRGAGTGASGFPTWSHYNPDSWYYGSEEEGFADPTCDGKCGAGGVPLHVPRFAAAGAARALAERKAFLFYEESEGPEPTFPSGTVSAWETLFDYAVAHPSDPRAAEALYWLIRISRHGQIHGRLGYRAFRVLHARYPHGSWTERSPYYFD